MEVCRRAVWGQMSVEEVVAMREVVFKDLGHCLIRQSDARPASGTGTADLRLLI